MLARLLLGVLMMAGAAASFAADLPTLPKAKGEACIEASATMRRDHPDMLRHQRDDTLRQGIRGAKASLKECVACHAAETTEGRAIPVNDPGQFCQSCHAYAAVKPDCFECHATTPKPVKEASR
ncbi:MAG: Hdr-like menaquinol oxidoreductase cytochrome c subunit [Magnetospirillum sp.]|nr:Hdr-like menaquinol oxidoreductase cytochrome c subunit [Magnetospirillum sp.]